MTKNEKEGGFISHLTELRSRLIHSFIFLFVFFILCYFFAEYLYGFLVEPYAQAVKNELNILWADYFKPEHVADHPNLHELFWNANKLAGANKQGVSSDSAKQLVEAVDQIAEIFWATKGVTYSDPNADVRYGA